MQSIFYDLETTSKHPIGQILNYCFTLVDRDFNPVRELAGTIRVSPLELPMPGAIAANRTDIIAHQAAAADTEAAAVKKIVGFINEALKTERQINFIGYNSAKFDLGFLRTTLMRNGVNPYFNKRLVYRDLLHCVRKLSCTRDDFPREAGEPRRGEEQAPRRLSLSLETTAKACGLLTGAQKHEAREDVHLTIALARCLRERFDMNVAEFDAYEARELHPNVRFGEVYGVLAPQYELDPQKGICTITPMTLLDANDRGALWIDLKRYGAGEGRDSIRWFQPATHWLSLDSNEIEDAALRETALRALDDFDRVNLQNYFGDVKCDIEQHIYKLDMSDIDALGAAMRGGAPETLQGRRNAQILFLRHRVAYAAERHEDPAWFDAMLAKYAKHRYGGDMIVEKFAPTGSAGGGALEGRHPTYGDMLQELAVIEATGDTEQKALMASLRRFYEASDIIRVAGAELAPKPHLGPDEGRNLSPRPGIER